MLEASRIGPWVTPAGPAELGFCDTRTDHRSPWSSLVKFGNELLRRHVAEGVFDYGGYLSPINLEFA
jgi:hypothetical protein